MNVRLRWAGAVTLFYVPALHAIAQESPAEPRVEQPAAKEPAEEPAAADAPLDQHRVILGFLMSNGLGGLNGGGGIGALGPPAAHVSYETRISGPAWMMLGLRGSIERFTAEGDDVAYDEASWRFGGFGGLRLEAPVHEYVAVGGYGVFEASGSETTVSYAWDVGLHFGAGLHFRPTRLFGVRLGIEVLEVGYAKSVYLDQASEAAFGRLTASPSLELTFSF